MSRALVPTQKLIRLRKSTAASLTHWDVHTPTASWRLRRVAAAQHRIYRRAAPKSSPSSSSAFHVSATQHHRHHHQAGDVQMRAHHCPSSAQPIGKRLRNVGRVWGHAARNESMRRLGDEGKCVHKCAVICMVLGGGQHHADGVVWHSTRRFAKRARTI